MASLSDLELLGELGVETTVETRRAFTPRQERIIAGFEDIQRFFTEHGRAPQHGEDRDIFERLYAVRLDRLRELSECRDLLAPMDHQGLLVASQPGMSEPGAAFVDDADLLAELGVAPSEDDITRLRNVRPREEIRAAEEIANREPCADFDRFRPLFEAVAADLKTGVREARRFGENAAIKQGEFFILGGQIAYVAEAPAELVITEHGHAQGRLRVIYDNGTESALLLRSMQRALYKDEQGRRITDPVAGPLFGDTVQEDDLASGTVYVLRSRSAHPFVAEHRDLIHKIGVTGQPVESRIAKAATDPTFLMAEVEIVATYKLFNINRSKLEAVIHRALAAARLDVAAGDRFGKTVEPREWFLVPLPVINELMSKIANGSIAGLVYDPERAQFVTA